MSKYEEICDVAVKARKDWIARRERCWKYMASLTNGFIGYSGIPREQVTFLRSNEAKGEERTYLEAEPGRVYSLLGATVLDKEDDYYHLGVHITLGPASVLSALWISFALCVTEEGGKPKVKLGFSGEPRQLDLDDPRQCE